MYLEIEITDSQLESLLDDTDMLVFNDEYEMYDNVRERCEMFLFESIDEAIPHLEDSGWTVTKDANTLSAASNTDLMAEVTRRLTAALEVCNG